MFSISIEQGSDNSNGFLLSGDWHSVSDVANVIGRVGKAALATSKVSFADVFNTLATLRHMEQSYIPNEDTVTCKVSSWDRNKMAEFAENVVFGSRKVIEASDSEIAAVMEFAWGLRNYNGKNETGNKEP